MNRVPPPPPISTARTFAPTDSTDDEAERQRLEGKRLRHLRYAVSRRDLAAMQRNVRR